MKDLILEKVKCHNGIKLSKLSLKVMDELLPKYFDLIEFHKVLEELIKIGEIKELDYQDPFPPYKVDRIYFLGGTKIAIYTETISETAQKS